MSNNENETIGSQTEMQDAVQSFEELLTPDNEKEQVETPEEEIAENQVEEVEAEDLDPEEDLQETEEETEFDEDISEEDEIETDHEQELIAIKVDGEEIEVTLDELKSGYSRQKDYTKKTQEISNQRKDLELKNQEVSKKEMEMSEERALYKELLPKMQLMLKNNMKAEPDWAQLIDEDPQEYLRQKQKWEQQGTTLNFIDAELERTKNEAYQAELDLIEQQKNEAKVIIADKIPEWKDDKIAEKEVNEISEYARSLGFTNEELSQVYDGRLVVLLRDAWQHSKTKKAVAKKPKESASRRVAKPGTATKPKGNINLKKAQQKLRQSGKVSDATKVFEQLI